MKLIQVNLNLSSLYNLNGSIYKLSMSNKFTAKFESENEKNIYSIATFKKEDQEYILLIGDNQNLEILKVSYDKLFNIRIGNS